MSCNEDGYPARKGHRVFSKRRIYDRIMAKVGQWEKAVVLWKNRLHDPADRSKTAATGGSLRNCSLPPPKDPKSSTSGQAGQLPIPVRRMDLKPLIC